MRSLDSLRPSGGPAREGQAPPTCSSGTEAELLVAIFRVMRVLRRDRPATSHELRRVLGQADLSPRHMVVLLHIASRGSVGVTDLSRLTGMGLPAVSAAVSDLARMGLVERREDDTDHRRTLASVAAEHRAAVEAIVQERLSPLERATQMLGTERVEALSRGLQSLADALDVAIGPEERLAGELAPAGALGADHSPVPETSSTPSTNRRPRK